MEKKIAFNQLIIQDLFKFFYIIPAYQREYVWKEKEVMQLLDDIHEAFSNSPESEYFLGSIVVCKSRDNFKNEVIDGQQRLITLSLILNVFNRLFISNKEDSSTIKNMLFSSKVKETGDTSYSSIIEIVVVDR